MSIVKYHKSHYVTVCMLCSCARALKFSFVATSLQTRVDFYDL